MQRDRAIEEMQKAQAEERERHQEVLRETRLRDALKKDEKTQQSPLNPLLFMSWPLLGDGFNRNRDPYGEHEASRQTRNAKTHAHNEAKHNRLVNEAMAASDARVAKAVDAYFSKSNSSNSDSWGSGSSSSTSGNGSDSGDSGPKPYVPLAVNDVGNNPSYTRMEGCTEHWFDWTDGYRHCLYY